jgi:hypothetical protein
MMSTLVGPFYHRILDTARSRTQMRALFHLPACITDAQSMFNANRSCVLPPHRMPTYLEVGGSDVWGGRLARQSASHNALPLL